MEQLVDSNQQKLKMDEIIKIAAKNTKSKYTFNQVYLSIMKELTMAGSIVIQLGNTIFLVHRSEKNPRYAMMRGLNADTPQNYLKNSEEFAQIAYQKYNIDVIVSQYTDPTLNNIFAYVGRNKPQDMGFNIRKLPNDEGFEATAKLGPLRGPVTAEGAA